MREALSERRSFNAVHLDSAFNRWAATLGVTDLLHKAREQARGA